MGSVTTEPLTNVWASGFSDGTSVTLPSSLFTKELTGKRRREQNLTHSDFQKLSRGYIISNKHTH